MHRILKPTGSIYLHCDPTASHYLKALLDSIFGYQNFRNEIIWRRVKAKGNTSIRLARNHDVILFYAASAQAKVDAFVPYDLNELPDKIAAQYNRKDSDDRRYQLTSLINPNRNRPNLTYEFLGVTRVWRWTRERMQEAYDAGMVVQTRPGAVPRFKRYLDEQRGMPLDDIWADVDPVSGEEAMGYDTQKPGELLERIIKISSSPGDVVLDPFCGCATTLEAAHKLERKWIGVDIAIHAIKRVARVRLNERLGLVEGQDYVIEGVPRTVEGAQDLWERDKYHFQKWAVEQVEGFVTTKRSADGGIDGRLYFAVPDAKDLQSMVIEVKGGANVSIGDLRALKGVLDDDTALIAGLIVMRPLGTVKQRNFDRFMGGAGTLEILGIEYPRMQLLTVGEILEGQRFNTPTVAGRHTPQPRFPGITA